MAEYCDASLAFVKQVPLSPQEIDLATCKPEDLDFCAAYSIQLRRKDFLHAFVGCFVMFSVAVLGNLHVVSVLLAFH